MKRLLTICVFCLAPFVFHAAPPVYRFVTFTNTVTVTNVVTKTNVVRQISTAALMPPAITITNYPGSRIYMSPPMPPLSTNTGMVIAPPSPVLTPFPPGYHANQFTN
jgi:hypothetical protein